ncbi:MAG: ABC transporter ATP-binding protein [Steroidobacteraceae bacterium]|nr:ABC transporter ATP-binding protein [Nevskiaceae bacterium]MCP5339704.1 ABC transporter ATP-binding protein [Nevskiaceae bacterium]MCP5360619.1 ABC transporter ATP-binding protein [Nevskiaceae bacterium]MCP5467233.1 ABC transporter ATP-binding protein [Nevskiaceae bacterium]
MNAPAPVLSVQDLTVRFATRRGPVEAVRGVSFELAAGRSLGIVGESGSGKSQTCFAIMGLLPGNARIGGSALLDGEQLVGLPRRRLDALRGPRMGIVFQDPMTALTPHRTIGAQLSEVLMYHEGVTQAEARHRGLEIMERVRITDPERRFDMYPFELSGGMRQRIVIAIALVLRPALLIADEPTTALDVTVQAEVLRTFRAVVDHTGTSLVLVTHDLGVVAGTCDEVAVMYAGRIVERADAATLFRAPAHPYTRALLDCRPRLDDAPVERLRSIEGQPPSPAVVTPGCAFAPRCAWADARCSRERPALEARTITGGDSVHWVACHREALP